MSFDIHLERKGTRIWMACRMRYDIPRRTADIPGHGFGQSARHKTFAEQVLGDRSSKGVWTFPLNYTTCLDLRAEFSDRGEVIHIGPELWKWAKQQQKISLELGRIRSMRDFPTPRLDALYPRLSEAIHHRAFQAVGIGFIVTGRTVANGDHPGLGKTLQAIGAAVEADLTGPLLVVGPQVAIGTTWPDEMEEWAPGEQYVVAEGSRDQRDSTLDRFTRWAASRPNKRSWLFVNNEMLQTERPPVKTKKSKKATWEDWLGYPVDPSLIPQLDNMTIEQPEPAEGSPAWRAAKAYEEAMENWDSTTRRHPALFDILWSGIFIDESQKVLPAKSSEARKQSQIRSGAQKLAVVDGGLRVPLSGTPWRGNPLNMWGMLHWMDPVQYPSFKQFVDRWFETTDNMYSDDPYANKVVEGVIKSQERKFGELVDRFMIRRTKSEAAPWLPSKVYAGTRADPDDPTSPLGVWLDLDPKQQKAYDEMTADAVARLESGDLAAIGVLAEMTRQKQFACSYGDVTQVLRKVPGLDLKEWGDTYAPKFPSNKWDWIVEFLSERGIDKPKEAWGEQKVVIGSWQTTLLNLWATELARLKIPCLSITGATSNADRSAAKKIFQAPGGPRVFLLNTLAGGVSLTLDAADDMVIIDETWVPDDQEQLEDRIHRLSRGEARGPATYWYLRSRGTIDEYIARTTESKDSLQKKLMDGRRGVDLARKLLTGGDLRGNVAA